MSNQFKYQAIAADGTITKGQLTAVDNHHVEEFLAEQDLRPIAIDEIKKKSSMALGNLFKGSSTEDLIMVTNGLATMQRAGVPLIKALTLIRVGSSESALNSALDQIRNEVQAGRSLSDAMAEFDRFFSPVYTAAVAAGEESGQLEKTLDALADMLETEMELNRQVKTAIRYPLIVIGVVIAAFFTLMTLVVPKFVQFFDSFGAELPLPTRVMIGISQAITDYWYALAIGVIALAYALRWFVGTEKGRSWQDRQLLKLPGLGEIIAKGNIARFALMFQILFKAGIPLVRSLEILARVVKNVAIAAEIRKLGELFRKGRDIRSLKKEFSIFPELALNMISIGMESGSLDAMTSELGKHYSKEVLYRSRQLTSIIEPVLTIILGLFVLVMALAIFLPMWSLIQVFRGG